MKLVLDGSVVRPPLSGVQVAVREQIRALLKQQLPGDPVVLCLDAAVRAAAMAAGAELCPPPWMTHRPGLRIAWQQTSLRRALRQASPAVLHAFAYTAPLHCPVPYVLNVHDIIALQHPEWCSFANRWHMRMLLPPSIRGAAAVIVSSQHVADDVAVLLSVDHARIHVAPLGVDTAAFAAPAGRLADLDRPYLLFVGNLEPKKGLPTLLSAYSRAADALGCDLVLSGRAAWKSADLLRRIRQYEGPGRIRLLGRVDQDQLPGLYQHAFAFVFPSLAEGFGMPILEAMSAGVPVVHSSHPVVVETAAAAGLVFQTGDAEDLRAQLLRLHDSRELREELVKKGRRRAEALPWSRWAECAAEILAAVACG